MTIEHACATKKAVVFLQFLLEKAAQVAQSQKDQVWVNNEIPCQSKIQPTNMLSILKVLSAKGQQSSSLLNFNSYPNENWKTKEVSINLQYNHKIALLNTYILNNLAGFWQVTMKLLVHKYRQ
jgi:hypothetical protein